MGLTGFCLRGLWGVSMENTGEKEWSGSMLGLIR